MPVYNNKLKDKMSTDGVVVFDSFQLYMQLTITQRQKSDIVFSELLDNLAEERITTEEYNLLATRKH